MRPMKDLRDVVLIVLSILLVLEARPLFEHYVLGRAW